MRRKFDEAVFPSSGVWIIIIYLFIFFFGTDALTDRANLLLVFGSCNEKILFR
jgi:hypothetical protein